MNTSPRSWQPYAALVTAMALWGSSFPAFKYALEHVDGWFLIWARLALASILILFIIPFTSPRRPSRGDWKWLLLMGLCEPCLYFVFEVYALQNTSAAQAGVIVALLPLIVAGAAALFLGEAITRRVLAGLVLALVGASTMSLLSQAAEGSPRPVLGNFLEFCAMVCATGYVLAIKKLSARHSPFFLVAVQTFIGVFFFLPFIVINGELWETFARPVPPLAWGTIVYLGLAVSLFAFYCNNVGLRHVPASRASAFVNLIPVFAVLLSVVLLGERLSLGQLGASALILVGLYLSQTERRKRVAAALS